MVSEHPQIVQYAQKNLVGVSTFMTLEDIGGPEPMLWDFFTKLDKKYSIARKASTPHIHELEIWPEKDLNIANDPMKEKFIFMVCVEVDNLNSVPPGCVGKTLPATHYAIFHYTGKPVEMVSAYKHIFLEWLPHSAYTQSHHFDYAYYNGHCESPQDAHAEMDIYIPIRPKIVEATRDRPVL